MLATGVFFLPLQVESRKGWEILPGDALGRHMRVGLPRGGDRERAARRSMVPPRDAAPQVDGNPIYVSPGVGLERGDAPQVRFLSRPAVAILTLADAV